MNILLVDDHTLFREGMAFLLRDTNPAVNVVHAVSVSQALSKTDGAPFALILLDLNLPGIAGRDAVAAMRQHFESVPLVVLSGEENPELVRWSIEAGAMGYITKSSDHSEMARALERVLSGQVYLPAFSLASADDCATARGNPLNYLTPRQLDVLRQLVQGKPNKLIARELGISDTTVKSHVTAVLQSLGLQNRTQVVYTVAKLGLPLS